MKIGANTFPAGISPDSSPDILGKLKPGDTVRAQILENHGSELTLKLSDGSKISAHAMSAVEASEGEFVNFVFKGTTDGKPVFEVMGRNFQPPADEALENIKNTLAELKLPITEENIKFAQALKSQNIPVTAESMTRLAELLSKNSELKPGTAAFITAANMSGDMNSIEKLQNLLAGRLKIGNDLGELLKFFNESSPVGSKSESADSMAGKVAVTALTANSGNTSAPNQSEGTQNKSAGNETVLNSGTAMSGKNAASTEAKAMNSFEGKNIISGNIPENKASDVLNKSGVGAAPNEIKGNSLGGGPASNSRAGSLATGTGSAGSAAANPLNDPTAGNINSNSQNISKLVDGLIENTKNNMQGIKNINDIVQQVSNYLKGGAPLKNSDLTVLNQIKSQLDSLLKQEEHTPLTQSAVKIIAKEITEEILKIQNDPNSQTQTGTGVLKADKSLNETVASLKNLFIKIDENSDTIDPVKLYKDLESSLQAIKSNMHQLPAAYREAMTNIINNLESNINFINQLNNYSSYIQIPLSIFDRNTTGELYMLKKGSKSKKLDPTNLTVLISLDSDNVGRIDTLLSIDKKNVSTNFRLENSDVFEVLKENHKQLYMNLLEKGYRLVDFTYRLMDEPLTIVNFEAEAKKEFVRTANSIDIVI